MPEVVLRQLVVDSIFRRLPRCWDVVKVPQGETVEGSKVVSGLEGSGIVGSNS